MHADTSAMSHPRHIVHVKDVFSQWGQEPLLSHRHGSVDKCGVALGPPRDNADSAEGAQGVGEGSPIVRDALSHEWSACLSGAASVTGGDWPPPPPAWDQYRDRNLASGSVENIPAGFTHNPQFVQEYVHNEDHVNAAAASQLPLSQFGFQDTVTGSASASPVPSIQDDVSFPWMSLDCVTPETVDNMKKYSLHRSRREADDTYLVPQPSSPTAEPDSPPPPPPPRRSSSSELSNFDRRSRTSHLSQLPGSPTHKDNNASVPSNVSVVSDNTVSSGYHSEDIPDYLGSRPRGRPITMSQLQEAGPEMAREFEEDELTLDFGDEEGGGHGLTLPGNPVLYQEYTGEDYSQYLQDDLDWEPLPPPPQPIMEQDTTSRKHRKKRALRPGSLSPNDYYGSNVATPTMERTSMYKKKPGIKQKFTQMFTLSRSHRQKHPPESVYPRSDPGTGHDIRLHNFSFADSKMGNMALSNMADVENHDLNNVTHYDPRETVSDLGLPKSWWNMDTLSTRSIRRHVDTVARAKRASSVPDMLDDTSMPQEGLYARSISQDWDLDSRSSRHSSIYQTKDRKSGHKSSSIWRKITQTLRGKKKLQSPHSPTGIQTPTHGDPEGPHNFGRVPGQPVKLEDIRL